MPEIVRGAALRMIEPAEKNGTDGLYRCRSELIIVHPETGRKVLKLSPMHARHILGLDTTESNVLLDRLARHLANPAYAYFHSWEPNDIIVWDNWRMIHGAVGIPLDCRRRAMRTTIKGDYKLGRLLDPSAALSEHRFYD